MNTAEIVAVIDQLDADDLEQVLVAYKARAKYLREASARQALATFHVGQRVSLTGVSPKYLNGLTGKITRRDGSKFVIEFDEESKWATGRFGPTARVPAGSLIAAP